MQNIWLKRFILRFTCSIQAFQIQLWLSTWYKHFRFCKNQCNTILHNILRTINKIHYHHLTHRCQYIKNVSFNIIKLCFIIFRNSQKIFFFFFIYWTQNINFKFWHWTVYIWKVFLCIISNKIKKIVLFNFKFFIVIIVSQIFFCKYCLIRIDFYFVL